MESIGGALRNRLNNQGLVLKHVARSVGLSKDTLQNYLHERTDVPEVVVRAICMTHGIPLEEFGLKDYRPHYLQRLG